MAYAAQEARLLELIHERDPQAYDLCDPHAARTTPPRGWEMVDDRPVRASVPTRSLADEDGTVALLAAALRGEPVGPSTGGDPEGLDDPEGFDEDEDPLRAALEEVQRVVDPDPTVPGADPTPLRRDRTPAVARPMPPAVEAPTSAPPRAAEPAEPEPVEEEPVRRRRVLISRPDDPDDEPTLW